MLDALLPAAKDFENKVNSGSTIKEAIQAATDASEAGGDATKSMTPKKGRSSYLGERVLGHPDPGAEAVAVWFRALASIS